LRIADCGIEEAGMMIDESVAVINRYRFF